MRRHHPRGGHRSRPSNAAMRLVDVATRFVDGVRAVEAFGDGLINDTFLVTSSTGEIVLQRFNLEVFPDPDAVMANIATVCHHVGDELLPSPVRTVDGEWMARVDGAVWRAWRRVPGAQTRLGSPDAARAAGTLLGRFHAAVADLDPELVA